MVRATNPIITLTIKNSSIDLSQASKVVVSIKQGAKSFHIYKENLDIEKNIIKCYLSQEDSLKLVENQIAKIQVNWIYEDEKGINHRGATKTREVNIEEQLLKEII